MINNNKIKRVMLSNKKWWMSLDSVHSKHPNTKTIPKVQFKEFQKTHLLQESTVNTWTDQEISTENLMLFESTLKVIEYLFPQLNQDLKLIFFLFIDSLNKNKIINNSCLINKNLKLILYLSTQFTL